MEAIFGGVAFAGAGVVPFTGGFAVGLPLPMRLVCMV